MSILIKGMEMPDNCHVCIAGYGGCCYLAPAEADGICPDNGRADFCPLIEIPKHGRLIDADSLCDGLVSNHPVVIHANAAPTIIPEELPKEET